jgi:hypothetical protein
MKIKKYKTQFNKKSKKKGVLSLAGILIGKKPFKTVKIEKIRNYINYSAW